jgi:hypothetical protein
MEEKRCSLWTLKTGIVTRILRASKKEMILKQSQKAFPWDSAHSGILRLKLGPGPENELGIFFGVGPPVSNVLA